MKIIFIEPPQLDQGNISRFFGSSGSSKAEFAWPPIELMSIAGYVRNFGIEVVIYDAGGLGKTPSEVKEMIAKEKPEIIVFSTSTTIIYSDVKVATLAKETDRHIVTVAVGTHVMARPEETLALNPDLDVTVYGDDEEVIIRNIAQSPNDLTAINGICWRNAAGKIIKNPPQKIVNNLDELGLPAHDLIDKSIYHDFMTRQSPMTLIMPQRGCINRCIFCICPALYAYRQRSVQHVIDELKWIKKLGYKEFKFISAGISYDFGWVEKLLDQMIENKLELSWWSNARADKLTPELLKKMKQAGCHTLAIGMESADPDILKHAGKNVTAGQVKKAVSLIKEYGMKTMVYFIFGLPGETRLTIKNTIKFAKDLDPDFATFGVAQPLPGTKFYEELSEKNLIKTNDWTRYDPVKMPVYEYASLSSMEIYNAARSAYRQFYLRPRYIIKRALQMRSPKDLINNVKNFIGLIRRYVLKNE